MIGRIKQYTLAALLGLLFTASAQAEPSHIIGGTTVNQDHPWMVALLDNRYPNDRRGGQFCGGTLIAPQWVLTAAHCFDDFPNADDVSVAIGVDTLSTTVPKVSVEAIFRHPDFDEVQISNDIALLKLAYPTSLAPLSIASDQQLSQLQNQQLLTVMGWGATSTSTPPEMPTTLLQTEVPYADDFSCLPYYSGYQSDKQICAGSSVSGDGDACQGDSGGPLIIGYPDNPSIAGIVSHGKGCASGIPGVYTQVSGFSTWINSYLQGLTGIQAKNATVDFGYQQVGQSNQLQATIQNHSLYNNTLSSENISLLAGGITPSIDTSDCTNLPAGGSCTIHITLGSPTDPNQAQFTQSQLALNFSRGEQATLRIQGGFLLFYSWEFNDGLGLPAIVHTGSNTQRSEASWQRQWDTSLGDWVAYSGLLFDNEESVMTTTLLDTGYLSFDWKIDSEPYADGLSIWVNGNRVYSISGSSNWTRKTLELSEAENQVTWIYKKNQEGSAGQDKVWLKNFSWQPGPIKAKSGDSSKSGLDLLALMLFLVLTIARLCQHQKPHRTRLGN